MTHTSMEQPEALRLAGELEQFAYNLAQQSARELRRLHASVQELEADNQSLRGINEDQDKALAELEKELSAAKDRIAELEASQAQRVPLSDAEIAGFDRYVAGTVTGRFARAKALVRMVEAKHGVTQEKQG